MRFLGALPLGDVLNHGDAELWLSRGVADQRDGQAPPEDATVPAHEPLFHAVMVGFAGQQPLEMRRLLLVVLRVREIAAGDGLQSGRVVAKHLLQGAVGFDDPALQILDGDAGAGALEQRPEASLAVGARHLRPPPGVQFLSFAQGPLRHRRKSLQALSGDIICGPAFHEFNRLLLADALSQEDKGHLGMLAAQELEGPETSKPRSAQSARTRSGGSPSYRREKLLLVPRVPKGELEADLAQLRLDQHAGGRVGLENRRRSASDSWPGPRPRAPRRHGKPNQARTGWRATGLAPCPVVDESQPLHRADGNQTGPPGQTRW